MAYSLTAKTMLGEQFIYAETESEFRRKLEADGYIGPDADDLPLRAMVEQIIALHNGDVDIDLEF